MKATTEKTQPSQSGASQLEARIALLEAKVGGREMDECLTMATEKLRKGGIRDYIASLDISDEGKEVLWQGAHLRHRGVAPKRDFKTALELKK